MVINAPVDQVFSFVNDSKRHSEWVTGVVRVEVASGKAGHIGECWTVVHSAGGIHFKGKATVREWEQSRETVGTLKAA